MARRPSDNRRTGDHADDEALEKRVLRIEHLIWWAIGGAAGVGFVVGAFSKTAIKLFFS